MTKPDSWYSTLRSSMIAHENSNVIISILLPDDCALFIFQTLTFSYLI